MAQVQCSNCGGYEVEVQKAELVDSNGRVLRRPPPETISVLSLIFGICLLGALIVPGVLWLWYWPHHLAKKRERWLTEDANRFEYRCWHCGYSFVWHRGEPLPVARRAAISGELSKLNELYEQGILSEEEWDRAKALFLGAKPNAQDEAVRLLGNLGALHAAGTLSQSEFNMKKWEILSKVGK